MSFLLNYSLHPSNASPFTLRVLISRVHLLTTAPDVAESLSLTNMTNGIPTCVCVCVCVCVRTRVHVHSFRYNLRIHFQILLKCFSFSNLLYVHVNYSQDSDLRSSSMR